MSDTLRSGQDLAVEGSLSSPEGRSTLVMQGDGNLVLYRDRGKARWSTGTAGKSVSQAVMQGDGNFVLYGPQGVLWHTETHGHPGAFLTLQSDGNVVIYGPAMEPLWSTGTFISTAKVPGFLPSSHGFHFSNSTFPSVPDVTINVLGNNIGIGDASNGLCGGMVFAARDFFDASTAIPPDSANPSSGVLFDYIVRRLFDSFNLSLVLPPPPFVTPTPPFGPGPATYLHLMNPDVPDHETVMSRARLSYRGRAWVSIVEEWPKIKSDLDSGRLSPIALVEVKSHDPLQMGQNHQVLAYGYELDGTDVTIRIYDPNEPDDDRVTLFFSVADPEHTTLLSHSRGAPVWCIFRPHYEFSFPPGSVQWQADWRWCHKCQGLFYSHHLASAGQCPAGGAHDKGTSGEYTLAHGQPRAPGQSDWRWCHKCSGLFFSGGRDTVGQCPGGGAHQKAESGNYTLLHEQPGAPGQMDWRWCHKCAGLFWAGGVGVAGVCPAGGTHEKGVSGNYSLLHRGAGN